MSVACEFVLLRPRPFALNIMPIRLHGTGQDSSISSSSTQGNLVSLHVPHSGITGDYMPISILSYFAE